MLPGDSCCCCLEKGPGYPQATATVSASRTLSPHFLLPSLPSSLSLHPSLYLADALDWWFLLSPNFHAFTPSIDFLLGGSSVFAYSRVPLFMTHAQVPESGYGSDRVRQRPVRVWACQASSEPLTSLQLGSSRRPFSRDSEPQHMWCCRSRAHAEGVTSGFETAIFLFLF